MEKGKQSPSREILNTLGQSGTSYFDKNPPSPENLLRGLGSDMRDKKAWRGRAKRKTVSQVLNLHLIEAAKKKGQPDRAKGYRNAYYCQNRIVSSGGRLYGQYCKNRSCTLCSSIRKAEIINKYLPVIQTWEDPFFLTLTVRAVPGRKLERWLEGFKMAFKRIREKYKKRNQRNGGLKLMGIKSLECNYNPKTKTFNPHLHLVVPNEAVADALIKEWLLIWTPRETSPKAQKKQRVRDLERNLVEVVKYGGKIFTDPDMKKRGQSTRTPKVYAAALDHIFSAMKPYRIFDRFGFNLPKAYEEDTRTPLIEGPIDEWVFRLHAFDWENTKTGERLSGYLPPDELQTLLIENIDTDLQ